MNSGDWGRPTLVVGKSSEALPRQQCTSGVLSLSAEAHSLIERIGGLGLLDSHRWDSVRFIRFKITGPVTFLW